MNNSLRVFICLSLLLCKVASVSCQCSTGSLSQTLSAFSSSEAAVLTSENYPSYYPRNHYCVSSISTSGSYRVLFYVDYVYIERYYDNLKIYSNSILKYHSDSELAPYVDISSGSSLDVYFRTDSSIEYGGFHLHYIAVDWDNNPACGRSSTASSTQKQLIYISDLQHSACTWTISSSDYVEIYMPILNGNVQIIESGATQSYYTQNLTYTSTTNTIQVKGTSGSDFVILYKEVSSGTGATTNISAAASSLTSSICDIATATSTTSEQYIKSPNYPGAYPNNLWCTVRIDADDPTMSISLSIIDLEAFSDDTLAIFDGPTDDYNLISGWISTGSNLNSSGSSVYLRFSTNYYGQNRGFYLSYKNIVRVVPVCTQNYVLDGNVTATSAVQILTSLNYPNDYVNDADVYYLIVKPNETARLVLDFREFRVEYALNCRWDYLSIYDGACTNDPLLATICGYTPSMFEDSTGLYILLHFHTDSSVTHTGWSLAFYLGNYQDPESSSSAEESSSIPYYIYLIIGIVVIVIVSTIILICFVCRAKGRVFPGSTINPPMKKRTTHDLLAELASKYETTETEKKTKIKRKGNNSYIHPQLSAPGPNVKIFTGDGQTPNPPLGQTAFGKMFRGMDNPVYQPEFIGAGSIMPNEQIAPMLTPQSKNVPQAPMPDLSSSSHIPPPFPYKTPAEARSEGTYRL